MAKDSSNKAGYECAKDCTALVTGSSGLCGARLVEMLFERGAKTVICFDLAKPSSVLQERFDKAAKSAGGQLIVCENADLTSDSSVRDAFTKAPKIDVVFHIGALVGPFHPYELYEKVNLDGTNRIIQCCRDFKVPRLVYSSSPSTRFTGDDVCGLREDQMAIPKTFLARYAETKAQGEVEVSKAHSPELRTISVAPHQVYGPHDSLFLPNLLETAGNGRLRIFGSGRSIISTCYVDNYAHGLMCGADAIRDFQSKAGGQFYIVTDGEPQNFWKMVNQAAVAMGFQDLYAKFHLPVWFLYTLAYICNVVGFVIGKKFKLNPFNVRMLTIHRYFSIENAQRDLQYQPLFKFEESWPTTIEWFRVHWLPKYQASKKSNGAKGD